MRKGDLPNSREAEMAVLAGMMQSPHAAAMLAERLDESDFFLERHQLLFRAFARMMERDASGAIDLTTIPAQLEALGLDDKVGGVAYVAGLDLHLPDMGKMETYADIVMDRAVRRRLLATMERATAWCYGSGPDERIDGETRRPETAEEIVHLVEGAAGTLAGQAARGEPKSLAEVYASTETKLESGECQGLPTGFPELDRLTSGMGPGQLWVVGGRPGMGKTSFGLGVACHVGIDRGEPVLFYSAEMVESELGEKIWSAGTGVPLANIRSNRMSTRQMEAVVAFASATHDRPLMIDDQPALTVAEISHRARRLRAKVGLSLVIVDYLQKLKPSTTNRQKSRTDEVSQIAQDLKDLAKDLRVPVMVMAQLNRESEHRADGRPRPADMKSSGDIEQEADFILFPFREKDAPRQRRGALEVEQAELIIGKARHSEQRTIEIQWHGPTTRYLPAPVAGGPF
ncbi:MAG: DnaB-like helicase C-terminal domain-containing protein [Acidobacteriota bacterium]